MRLCDVPDDFLVAHCPDAWAAMKEHRIGCYAIAPGIFRASALRWACTKKPSESVHAEGPDPERCVRQVVVALEFAEAGTHGDVVHLPGEMALSDLL